MATKKKRARKSKADRAATTVPETPNAKNAAGLPNRVRGTATVKADQDAPMFASPAISADRVGLAKRGTKVDILGWNAGNFGKVDWTLILINGETRGFVDRKLLTKDDAAFSVAAPRVAANHGQRRAARAVPSRIGKAEPVPFVTEKDEDHVPIYAR